MQPEATEALTDYTASVTNELITTSITVVKNWQNLQGRSYSVEVRLLNGSVVVDSITFNSTSTTQRHTFENLPVYDANGNRITYTIREVEGDTFNATITQSSTEANTYTITNTAPDPTPTPTPTVTPTPVVTSAPTPTATTQTGTGGGGGGGSGSTAAPTPAATVTATPTATVTVTPTPTTTPTTVPVTGPTATPRPMPEIPEDASGRTVSNVQSYYDIDDMDTPLGAGENMNLGDCFD